MKTIFDIAAAGYYAHGKELQRRIGVNQRPWGQLPTTEKLCWVEATRQVMAEVAAMGCSVPGEPVSQSVAPLQVIDAELGEEHRHAIRT
jgi:hypothetical protein